MIRQPAEPLIRLCSPQRGLSWWPEDEGGSSETGFFLEKVMIRLIFFPAARLIEPVSSENVPRFPLPETKHNGNKTFHEATHCDRVTSPLLSVLKALQHAWSSKIFLNKSKKDQIKLNLSVWTFVLSGTRCSCGPFTLLPMMSVGDNCRKRTGRMSYLLVPHFLSLLLSPVSLDPSWLISKQHRHNKCLA